ncbi:hypothetical protein JTE90_029210 [Oedothorax gibbosus]|uniref:Uncharacterized protein n=1 Tax=Oedothorax gibbosus TaxID=931172 RepID=A0AAV6VCG1_9ARAC|nr:hypothetical protein JTE90_029210 [Oedothorax gibbosus]
MWSIQARLARKQACSGRSLSSTALFIHSSSIFVNILLETFNSVIPLQFSHDAKSPFFGSFRSKPSFQSSGITPSSKILLNSSICLPCLKSSETGEKETEDYRQDLNPFANKVEENTELGNEYPDNLNPFGSEKDEENKNLNGKEEKGQQEDEYPDGLNPFASDDEEYEQENDYPEELNPFTDDAENEQENDYPDELNPFADDEENEQENDYPEELNPFTDDEENYYPDKLNPFTDDEKNEQKNDYPEELNPFTDDEENEQENDYPDELNPFADEKEDKADTAIANQCSLELSPELNSPAINGSSSTVPLPNEEKVDDGKDESEQHEDEYPDCLNPFAIEAEENEQHDDDYPDELNPFFDEEGDAADTAKVNQNDESEEEKYPDSLNPFAKEDDENDYPEELNPFADDKGEADDTAKVNQRSPELAPELTPPAINGCPSKVPLPNEEKTEDGKDESKQQEVEYPDSLNPFGSEDDENQYPEELNPFADDAADTAKVNQCSLELAELTLPAINGSSATSPLTNKRKA